MAKNNQQKKYIFFLQRGGPYLFLIIVSTLSLLNSEKYMWQRNSVGFVLTGIWWISIEIVTSDYQFVESPGFIEIWTLAGAWSEQGLVYCILNRISRRYTHTKTHTYTRTYTNTLTHKHTYMYIQRHHKHTRTHTHTHRSEQGLLLYPNFILYS